MVTPFFYSNQIANLLSDFGGLSFSSTSSSHETSSSALNTSYTTFENQIISTRTPFQTSSTTTFSSASSLAFNAKENLPQGAIQGALANNSVPTSAATGGLSSEDLALISSTESLEVRFIESLQKSNGAIVESNNNPVVYPRDLSLAAIALTLSGNTAPAERAIEYLLSLPPNASNFSDTQGNRYTSPSAWAQTYSIGGQILDPSVRGEDQGMSLFAISTYVQKSGNFSLARSHWSQIEGSANFILYLQHAPEPWFHPNGMYRHGDNWHDSRKENMNGSTPTYWPYWPEYYEWEEENMRMINGLRGAISLAQSFGHASDVEKWSASLNLALTGLDNESIYNKYETYDYFGSVLWGIQTNLQSEKSILAAIPKVLFTPVGIRDLSWENFAGSSDTIDYMVCLLRVGDYANTTILLHDLTTNFENPRGGFYDGIRLNNTPASLDSMVYSSARFVYFAYVASTLG